MRHYPHLVVSGNRRLADGPLRLFVILTSTGVYAGDGSDPDVRERLESSDLILSIGAIKSDFNTAVSDLNLARDVRYCRTESVSRASPTMSASFPPLTSIATTFAYDIQSIQVSECKGCSKRL